MAAQSHEIFAASRLWGTAGLTNEWAIKQSLLPLL
jgi:hypothetical protein